MEGKECNIFRLRKEKFRKVAEKIPVFPVIFDNNYITLPTITLPTSYMALFVEWFVSPIFKQGLPTHE